MLIFDSRHPFLHNSSIITISFINNQWFRMSNNYISDAALLNCSQIQHSFPVTPNKLKLFNLVALHTYTTHITQKTYLTLLNKTQSSQWFVPQLRRHSIVLHQLKKTPQLISKRCDVSICFKKIKNVQANTSLPLPKLAPNDSCLCTQFSYQSLLNTKCQPLGKLNCNTNLETILKSLGLYQKFINELTFCSNLAMLACDIGTS